MSAVLPIERKETTPVYQLALFDTGPWTLVEDEHGGIVYRPDLFNTDEAEHCFDALRDQIHWQHEIRQMAQRQVEVPRLTAHFEIDDEALPAILKAAGKRVSKATGVRYTSVSLNFYRDGRDSVAPHHDRLEDLVPGYPIALLSLGSARRMRFSSQSLPRRSLQVDLAPGSLLTMSYASQSRWLHAIPKRPGLQPPRISIGFRVRPSGRT